MPAIATFPTFLRFPLGGARQLLDRVLRAGGQMNHLGGGASMEPLAAQVVAANWWESGGATGCVAAYQPKGAASLAASYVNRANAGTYDLVFVGGNTPTIVSGGISINGGTLDTGIVPASTSWSYIMQVASKTAGRFLFGSFNSGSQVVTIEPRFVNNNSQIGYGNCSFGQFANAASSGNFCMAGQKAYYNGVFDADLVTGTAPTNTIWFAGLHGLAGFELTAVIVAFAIYNNTLSASTVAAVAAAMAAL